MSTECSWVRKKAIVLHFWVFVLLFSVAFAMGSGADDALFSKLDVKLIKEKKRVPSVVLQDTKGQKINLKSFKGKVIFLNFWATWCGPCKEEMPSMQGLHQEFKDKEFIFLAISVDYEGLAPVKKFIVTHGYTFPVLVDPNGDTLELFDVQRIPSTFFIDKEGRMIGKVIGPRDWKSKEMVLLVNRLIQR